jgi:SAM-dependent MidA family methyltransferase
VEIGPGDGSLASGLRRALPWWPPARRRLLLVESSPVLAARQREKLGRAARWFEQPAAALSACGGAALVFANELADAFPPDVLEWRAGAWHEVCLEIAPAGQVREALRPATDPPHWSGTDPAAWPGGRPPEGQRVEVLASFRDWLAGWLPGLRRGEVLWIDYGDHFPALYHRRPRGTLRAYHRHQRHEGLDVFRRLGRQDITCDVNFTDLGHWGEAAGLVTLDDCTLGEFLARHGAASPGDPAATAAPATAFRVLRQGRREPCRRDHDSG